MCRHKTICNIENIIILQNFFCTNRSFLIHNKGRKLFCDFIFTVCFIFVSSAVIYDLTHILTNNIFLVIFQFVIGLEAAYIMCTSRNQTDLYDAITRLDEKCVDSDEYFTSIRHKANKIAIMTVMSVLFDVFGMYLAGLSPTSILMMTMAFSAHDSEMAFCSLLINGFNLRLASLVNVAPSYGARVYRHVLASASHLKEESNIRILLMIAMTLLTSIAYAVIIFLIPDAGWNINIYLLWRESRSLYMLWMLCNAAAKTKKICDRLVLHLAKRLVFDFRSSDKSLAHQITHRWYTSTKTHRPQYVNGTTFSINLTVPLKILDYCCNYLLIILQVYVFYKQE